MSQLAIGFLLGLFAMAILVALVGELYEQRRSNMITSAQDMEIGEGVTLSQGIDAFFGYGSHWGLPEGNWVRVLAGIGRPTANLYVYPKTGEIKIRRCETGGDWEDERGRDFLLGLMVQAAKAQGKGS